MKIIVPMAGRGSRFQAVAEQNPEYKKPKPLINVKRKPMVVWAIKSLPHVSTKDLVFICLQQHEDDHKITKLLKRAFAPNINVVLIPEVTRGAVETVLSAKKYISPEEDFIISDSDHYFDGSNLYKMISEKDNETMGIIPVFKPPDEEVKWSYTLFDKDHTALAVAEKDPVLAAKGAYANIGAYYFSKGKVFISEAEEMINGNEMYGPAGKQEFFVAPLYERMIKKGMKIKAAILPKVWGLGTPKDLDFFLANHQN